jgi:hypothetical protein
MRSEASHKKDNCRRLFSRTTLGGMKTDEKRYDFGGVPGNLVLIIFLPVIVYYLYFCLRFNGGRLLPVGITAQVLRAFWKDIVPTGRAFGIYGCCEQCDFA